MASKEIEKLVTTLEVNMRNFEKKLNAANNNAKRKTSSIQRNFDKMNRNVSQGVGRHFSNAAKSISVVHGPLGGVASRVSGIGSILSSVNPLLAGTSLAMTGLGFAAYKALTAFQAFETQQLVTEQVLRTTGSSAGRTASQIEALAQSVGMTTLASITGAREAATQLLTFRSISGETFDRTLRLSQDLAAVGFGSLSSAAKQLGKALEDPRTGLTQLRRVGVSFSETQKQVIYDLFDTGQAAEAQEKILDALEKQVGGAGAASGQGLAGAYDTLSEATQLLLERWGSQIAEALNLKDAIFGIARAVDAVNQRASLGGRLLDVNRRISSTREALDPRIANVPGMDNPFTQGRHARPDEIGLENELNKLLQERHALQMRVFHQGEEASVASIKAIEAQKQAEQERADGVIANLTKQIELEKLSNTEKQIQIELSKAGVTAESEAGQKIIALEHERAAVEAARRDAKKADKSSEKAVKATEREKQAIIELIDEMQFEISIMGLSNREKEIAIALRRAGAAATDLEQQKIAELTGKQFDLNASIERNNQAMQDMRDLGRNVLGGFVDDIRNGISAADALANALQKVIDKLLDSAFDGLFGGGGGFLGSLLGFGGGGAQYSIAAGGGIGLYHSGGTAGLPRQTKNVSPSVFAGAPRYHNGGVAGFEPLKGNEIPAILERGEKIIPNNVSNLSRGSSVTTIRLVDDSGRMADIARQTIQTEKGPIVFEAVNTSRQAVAKDLKSNIQQLQRRG